MRLLCRAALALGLAITLPALATGLDLGRAIGAAADLGKAATVSDDEVKNYARQMRAYEERSRENAKSHQPRGEGQ